MKKTIKKITVGLAMLAMLPNLGLPAHAGSIDTALSAQSEEAKTRFQYRNPKETLNFFNIEEGMTVVEALPGGGWYSKILLPVLGEKGTLIGADYPQSIWTKFSFMTPDRIKEKEEWVKSWTIEANQWRSEGDANVKAVKFDSIVEEMNGTADRVLFIRALHNLARFEKTEQYLTNVLSKTHALLKEDGLVGVVQHEAREDRPDSWADGSSGYLKKSTVLAFFEANGFELVSQSDINSNPLDQAIEGDIVWRLPPTLMGSKNDAIKKEAMLNIGESNRMTLLFKKMEK